MKKLLLTVAIATAFLLGYGAVGKAALFPIYGRDANHGYFTNYNDTAKSGTFVFPKNYKGGTEAFPSTINSANEFISFIESKLGGDRQERTGAAFIIQTMIGSARNRPPTPAQIREWEGRVRAAERDGRVDWRRGHDFNINSYYIGPTGGGGANDDAFYPDDQNVDAMIFYNDDRSRILYAIKWACANPVGDGDMSPIPDAGPQFDLNGRSEVSNTSPIAGSRITFTHFIGNAGPDSTSPTPIRWVTRNSITLGTVKGPVSMGIVPVQPQRILAAATEKDYLIPASTPAGTKICRQIGWAPDRPGAGIEWSTPACATVRYNFNLTPSVSVTINGNPSPDNVAEPGDIIQFIYSVTNSGTTQSQNTSCNVKGKTVNGYQSPPPILVDTGEPTTCGVIPKATSITAGRSPNITAAASTTVCRSLTVTPATADGASLDSGATCVVVASKPYVKVFGGDVSVGGGVDTSTPGTCGQDSNAGIISWNKRRANGWAGAGAEYAAMALRTINDFATTRPTNGADAPSGLAFRNNDISATNQDTGLFGNPAGGVSCIPNYYDGQDGVDARASALSIAGSSILFDASHPPSSTTYKKSGDLELGGTDIYPGQRVVIYVDGNLYISGNVVYKNKWSVADAPLFQVIVRGNIYINPNVGQLDGTYVAVAKSGTVHSGEVYTCTDPSSPYTPLVLNGALLDLCDNTKLTVNGSVVADRILLLRTLATLRNSNDHEDRGANQAAEVFNYSPANWIAQPGIPAGFTQDTYDSITSLPPVL